MRHVHARRAAIAVVIAVALAGCTSNGVPRPSPPKPSEVSTGTIAGVLHDVTGLVQHPAAGTLTLTAPDGHLRRVMVPTGGHFRVTAEPGRYILTGVQDCQRIPVVVTRGAVTHTDIQCGISTD